MKFLVIDKFGDYTVKDAQTVPRVGDKIFNHNRVVKSVVMWPTEGYIKEYLSTEMEVEAIICID